MQEDKLKKLRSCIKEKDGWWASVFAGPLANRLLEPICELEWLTPNHLTLFSLFIGLLASYFFIKADHLSLLIGGLLVQLSFVVDCMDGQFARYSKKFSELGAWLDRIADRVKDFAYFFSLSLGFFLLHGEKFHFSFFSCLDFIYERMPIEKYFQIDPHLQGFTMQATELPTWIIFPLAMIAMFSIFLIDYYVNQDMKFPSRGNLSGSQSKSTESPEYSAQPDKDLKQSVKKSNAFLAIVKFILKFGLQVYRSIPILRFNIGEQALLISIFCFFDAVFLLNLFFALLGSFYVFYWPFAKYLGFTESK